VDPLFLGHVDQQLASTGAADSRHSANACVRDTPKAYFEASGRFEGRSPLTSFLNLIRTYAKAIPACGSMVLFFFVGSFFALRAKKEPTKGKNPWFAKSY
jgi:hypothetical protein